MIRISRPTAPLRLSLTFKAFFSAVSWNISRANPVHRLKDPTLSAFFAAEMHCWRNDLKKNYFWAYSYFFFLFFLSECTLEGKINCKHDEHGMLTKQFQFEYEGRGGICFKLSVSKDDIFFWFTACNCTYDGKTYPYHAVIYNTTDGIGACILATCGPNGTINRTVYECPVTTTPFVFTSSTPITTTTGTFCNNHVEISLFTIERNLPNKISTYLYFQWMNQKVKSQWARLHVPPTVLLLLSRYLLLPFGTQNNGAWLFLDATSL